jgi:predicted ATPase
MQEQAFNYSAEINRPLTTGYVHSDTGARLEQLRGNVDAVLAHTRILTALMRDHTMRTWQGPDVFEGWAISWSGNPESGIALMQRGLANRDTNGNVIHQPYFLCLLAQIHSRVGDVRKVLTLCDDAKERAQRTEEYIWLAELYRIEGEVRRAAGHPSTKVEGCLKSAIDLSRRQGARMFELRAAIDLARLWRDQGKDVEARNLLVPVYGWFTEGFDTIHLKDAKALLVELSD